VKPVDSPQCVKTIVWVDEKEIKIVEGVEGLKG